MAYGSRRAACYTPIDMIEQTLKQLIPPRVLEEAARQWGATSRALWESLMPPIDIVDTGNQLVITMDLPGFERETLRADLVEGNVLVIQGQRPEQPTLGKTLVKGRPTTIEKRIRLPIYMPEGVPPEQWKQNVTANFVSGVLTVTIKKPDIYRIPITGPAESSK